MQVENIPCQPFMSLSHSHHTLSQVDTSSSQMALLGQTMRQVTFQGLHLLLAMQTISVGFEEHPIDVEVDGILIQRQLWLIVTYPDINARIRTGDSDTGSWGPQGLPMGKLSGDGVGREAWLRWKVSGRLSAIVEDSWGRSLAAVRLR